MTRHSVCDDPKDFYTAVEDALANAQTYLDEASSAALASTEITDFAGTVKNLKELLELIKKYNEPKGLDDKNELSYLQRAADTALATVNKFLCDNIMQESEIDASILATRDHMAFLSIPPGDKESSSELRTLTDAVTNGLKQKMKDHDIPGRVEYEVMMNALQNYMDSLAEPNICPTANVTANAVVNDRYKKGVTDGVGALMLMATLAYLARSPLKACMRRASAASAFIVSKFGMFAAATLVTPDIENSYNIQTGLNKR